MPAECSLKPAPKIGGLLAHIAARRRQFPPPGLDELAARTRATYDGPLTIGEDLLRFGVGDQVTVIPLYTEYGSAAEKC